MRLDCFTVKSQESLTGRMPSRVRSHVEPVIMASELIVVDL